MVLREKRWIEKGKIKNNDGGSKLLLKKEGVGCAGNKTGKGEASGSCFHNVGNPEKMKGKAIEMLVTDVKVEIESDDSKDYIMLSSDSKSAGQKR